MWQHTATSTWAQREGRTLGIFVAFFLVAFLCSVFLWTYAEGTTTEGEETDAPADAVSRPVRSARLFLLLSAAAVFCFGMVMLPLRLCRVIVYTNFFCSEMPLRLVYSPSASLYFSGSVVTSLSVSLSLSRMTVHLLASPRGEKGCWVLIAGFVLA